MMAQPEPPISLICRHSPACRSVWLVSTVISNPIGCLAVVNGAHRRTILPLPKRCPSRGAITTLDVIEWAVRGKHVRSIVHQTPLQCRQYAPRSAQDWTGGDADPDPSSCTRCFKRVWWSSDGVC